jgi:hypothetical protein
MCVFSARKSKRPIGKSTALLFLVAPNRDKTPKKNYKSAYSLGLPSTIYNRNPGLYLFLFAMNRYYLYLPSAVCGACATADTKAAPHITTQRTVAARARGARPRDARLLVTPRPCRPTARGEAEARRTGRRRIPAPRPRPKAH